MPPSPIDHLPLYGRDLDQLGAAFEALGFTVSPHGTYLDPAGDEWINRSVFLQAGWFDLLEAPGAPADTPYTPKACLFRSGAPAAAAASEPLRADPAYRLERRWAGAAPDAPAEAFEIVNLRERIAPLPLALIAHAEPMGDVAAAWRSHPNGAVQVAGMVFGGAEPGPMARAASKLIDLSVFGYAPAADFSGRFGPGQSAVVVKTVSLEAAGQALNHSGFSFKPEDGGLDVPAQGPFGCGWRFEPD